VLLTGGTKSVGPAIVVAFLAEGAAVGFWARNAKLVKLSLWFGEGRARALHEIAVGRDGAQGVRIKLISPGSIPEGGNTLARQHYAGSERYERTLSRNPTGRMGSPREAAAPVIFLAGAPASPVAGIDFVIGAAVTTRGRY
jgi:NAD(P)-dependent dehydrogenase (short-subunit alcohol dehydrogenase family)